MYIKDVEIMSHECGTKEEYIAELLKRLNGKHTGKYQFEKKTVDALNGTEINTIVALDTEHNEIFLIPVVDAYESTMFMGPEEVFEIINYNIEQYELFYATAGSMEKEKQIIQPWIINKDMNKDLLHRCPYMEYGDYAIVYRTCPSFNDYQLNYGLITWEIAGKLSLDLEQLHELAMENAKDVSLYKISSYNGVFFEDVDDFSYCKGNKYVEYMVRGIKENCSNGSLFCQDIWKKIGKMIGENYYIIPSSVHEWQTMSISMTSKEHLAKTIIDVNKELKLEYVLGNHFYLYDIAQDKIVPMRNDDLLTEA